MAKWRVTLCNQHAACCYTAEGSTRWQAFLNALDKASVEFLTYKVPARLLTGNKWWFEQFYACHANFKRSTTAQSLEFPEGVNLTLRRVGR